MTIDLTSALNTVAAGLGLAGILAGIKLSTLFAKLDERLNGHVQLDDQRHADLSRRVNRLEEGTIQC